MLPRPAPTLHPPLLTWGLSVSFSLCFRSSQNSLSGFPQQRQAGHHKEIKALEASTFWWQATCVVFCFRGALSDVMSENLPEHSSIPFRDNAGGDLTKTDHDARCSLSQASRHPLLILKWYENILYLESNLVSCTGTVAGWFPLFPSPPLPASPGSSPPASLLFSVLETSCKQAVYH